MEGTVFKINNGKPVQVPVSQLPPLERDALRRGIRARKEHCLHLMGRQAGGGVANFVLMVSVMPLEVRS